MRFIFKGLWWQFESFKQSQFNIFTPIMASDAIYVTVVDEHYLFEALECAMARKSSWFNVSSEFYS